MTSNALQPADDIQDNNRLKKSAAEAPEIVLCTMNAKYIHAAFGLRYLYANMKELQPKTRICEFNINQQAEEICEQLLKLNPRLIGFGVYIWNTQLTHEVITLLKQVRPEIIIILGGPEVSYETKTQSVYDKADYVITGMADFTFYQTCKTLLQPAENPFAILPKDKIIRSEVVDVKTLEMPYRYYNDTDIAQRVLYVEASRGCPFKCEFCLSSLDKTAWPFDTELFLNEMNQLYRRGARHFKFVDRTFNLKVKSSIQILKFFLDRIHHDNAELFLHFELIPDNLPEALKSLLTQFPPGCLQFEIGIQTFTPDVQQRISRKQNNAQSKDNIRWLLQNTTAHLHTDLIFGLPGETLQSFADSFDELVSLQPHEIQFGILKRLKGTPIIRHSEEYQLTFNDFPPFNILSNSEIDYLCMREMVRFARYWDMIYNSGRFSQSIPFILENKPFQRFRVFSQWLYNSSGATHKIALQKLFEYVYRGICECSLLQVSENDDAANQEKLAAFTEAFLQDFQRAGFHHQPAFIDEEYLFATSGKAINHMHQQQPGNKTASASKASKRQHQHLS